MTGKPAIRRRVVLLAMITQSRPLATLIFDAKLSHFCS
jgi:hypothetical protein